MASPFARTTSEIETPCLVLGSPTTADTEALYKLLTTLGNDPYNPPESGLTPEKPEKLRAHIGNFADSTMRGENAWLVFILRESNEIIGFGAYKTFEIVYDAGSFLNRPDAPF